MRTGVPIQRRGVHVGAYVPEPLAAQVRERAREEYTNQSTVLRKALAAYLRPAREGGRS